MKRLLCLILMGCGVILSLNIGLCGEEEKGKERYDSGLILQKIAEKIKNAFPDKRFYDHGGVLDEIGFFTKEFTWQEQWGDKDAPYISIFGVKYTRYEYYKMIYEAILKRYGSSGFPREYWPKFVPDPAWKGWITRERDPKARVPWVQRKRELWEEYHYRKRTPDEIGEAQDMVVWWYRGSSRDSRDDEYFIGSFLVNYILKGYDPLIFARPEVFEGAKKWNEKVLASPKGEVSEDDRLSAEEFLREYREGTVDRLPKSKEEMEKEREKSEAAVREGMRWVEEKKASRTPEEIEEDRKREEERRERKRIHQAEMDELVNDFPRLIRSGIDNLKSQPNLTEEQKMAIEEGERMIREYHETMAKAEKAKTRPKEGDIFNYRLARFCLMDPFESNKEELVEMIHNLESRFPELKATAKDVIVQLNCPNVTDWEKYEKQKVVVIMEPRDPEMTVTARKPCKVTARGHLKFALFDDYKNFKIELKPTAEFPFSGKIEWSWDEISDKPLLFNLNPVAEGR